jgi:hypothetical protein
MFFHLSKCFYHFCNDITLPTANYEPWYRTGDGPLKKFKRAGEQTWDLYIFSHSLPLSYSGSKCLMLYHSATVAPNISCITTQLQWLPTSPALPHSYSGSKCLLPSHSATVVPNVSCFTTQLQWLLTSRITTQLQWLPISHALSLSYSCS